MAPRAKAIELEVTGRDYVMARLAAARAAAQSALDSIDDALALFVDPDDDDDGSERADLVQTALESAGAASRALESAEEVLPQIDPEEGEPWDDEDDEDEDEDKKGPH